MCVGTEGPKGEMGLPGENCFTLSLVTGTRNRRESLQRLINSIINNALMPWELIVADASDEPINYNHETVAGFRIKILPEHPRLGVSKGYNKAFAMATGKYVMWLNDDAEVLRGFDTAAAQFMENYQQIGLGALYYQEGQQDFHVNAYLGMTYANFGIMNREFGNSIGWFDEDFPMYGSDNALAFKTLLADKGVAGIPDAKIIHHAVNDIYRQENNQLVNRWRDVDALMTKYGPHVRYMRGIYHAMRLSLSEQMPAEVVEGKDHTPPSLAEKYK